MLLDERKDAISHRLYDALLFGHHFQSFEAQIVASVTRGLDRRTDLDPIAIFDIRVSDQRPAANAQHGHRDCRLVFFQAKQVGAITVVTIRNRVGSKRLHIPCCAVHGDVPKMVSARFFEYRLDADRFFRTHQQRRDSFDKCQGDSGEKRDELGPFHQWTHSIMFFAWLRSDFLFPGMAAIIRCLLVVEGHAYEK